MKIHELGAATAETHLDIFKCLSAEKKVIAAHESLVYRITHEVEQIVLAEDIQQWKVSGG
ncbi:peptidase [Pseudomonas sp. 1912-s]|uniref:peptidase n=1 Tax=unclassified Pseudomonas TaxID=196821 RepID=UPI0023DEB446|nr:peptidase [Pseudomonas sp. 1912-s]MDF3198467.1 peptidase [Pseudomonas sp. 1912-s]